MKTSEWMTLLHQQQERFLGGTLRAVACSSCLTSALATGVDENGDAFVSGWRQRKDAPSVYACSPECAVALTYLASRGGPRPSWRIAASHALSALALVLLAGCGGGDADFSGAWAGTLTDVEACKDGYRINVPVRAALVVTQRDGTLEIAGGQTCGLFVAAVRGDTAEIQPHECHPVQVQTESGHTATWIQSLVSGAVVHRGSSLDVSINLATALSSTSGSSTTCEGTFNGTLTKS